MHIYDSTSIAFIKKAEAMAREILESAGFKVHKRRFEWKGYFYPLHVVVFEGREWGHFNAPYFQIGLNRKLIFLAKDSVVRDVLKHELAHYLTFILHREVSSPHGAEFKQVCRQFGFPEEVAAATMDLEASNLSKEGDLDSERVLEKVKKLLQLAQSSNVHEAELATMKANQLLLRHNIDHLAQDDEPIYLDRLLPRSRKDAKLSAIYDILRHFIVRPVISMGRKTCCLEVSGSKTNVQLARYVAEFLDRELEQLWDKTKKEHAVSGLRQKNSFFAGIAKGFEQKMKQTKAQFSAADQKALVVVEEKLNHDTRMIYRRLTSSYSTARTDEFARQLGVEKGLSLTIRKGVETQAKNLYLTGPRE